MKDLLWCGLEDWSFFWISPKIAPKKLTGLWWKPFFLKIILFWSAKSTQSDQQRWSPRGHPRPRGRPRGHTFKSLALASKPQVLENCPVLGSRTALFFQWQKFCRSAEKCFSRPFFLEIDGKRIFKTFFLRKTLAFVSLILGLEHFCPWPWPRIFFLSLVLCPRLHLCWSKLD